jgi:DNA uptake protein ComE-like DNA-binding protein
MLMHEGRCTNPRLTAVNNDRGQSRGEAGVRRRAPRRPPLLPLPVGSLLVHRRPVSPFVYRCLAWTCIAQFRLHVHHRDDGSPRMHRRFAAMPTPSEKKAIAFLSAFALLGAGVRMQQAVSHASAADATSREALRRQIVAAESASAADRRGHGARPAKRARGRPVNTLDSVMNAPVVNTPSIFDPPRSSMRGGSRGEPRPAAPVDVDRASAAELEALPRIGPALAQRIVEDREVNGPFGSLEGLQRVRGVGPAMAAVLANSVTFSGTPRPSIAGRGGRDRSIVVAPGSRRRPAPP